MEDIAALPLGVKLERAMRAADFTQSDMARWLDVPRLTMMHWVWRGGWPRSAVQLQHCEVQLALLRRRITDGLLPVPHHVHALDRKAYLKRLLDGVDARFPDRNSA